MGPFSRNTGGGCSLGSCPGSRPTVLWSSHCRESPPTRPSTPPAPLRNLCRLPSACVLALRHSCAVELHSAAPLQSFVRGPLCPASLHCCRLRARLPSCALLCVSRKPLRAGSQRQASLERLCGSPTLTARGASAGSRPETERLATPQLFSSHPRCQVTWAFLSALGFSFVVLARGWGPEFWERLSSPHTFRKRRVGGGRGARGEGGGNGERSVMMGWVWKSSLTGLDRAKSSPPGLPRRLLRGEPRPQARFLWY